MLKRKIAVVLLILILAFSQVFILPASADSANITAPTSAYLGDEITVNVTFESTASTGKLCTVTGILEFDASVLRCVFNPPYTSIDADKEGKYIINYQDYSSTSSKITLTFKFKGVKAGTAGIFVSAITSDGASNQRDCSYNTSVKIIDKNTLSSNAKAKEILISAGNLVPQFNPNITNYNVNVDYSVKEVLLSITTQEEKSKIDIKGDKDMEVGNNTRTVIITAPNGNVLKYTINIYRGAQGEKVTDPQPPELNEPENPYQIAVGNDIRFMIDDYNEVDIPANFSLALVTIGDTEMQVLKDIVNGRIVVYATDMDGKNGDYYLYDQAKNSFSTFRYIKTEGVKLVALDYNQEVPNLNDYTYTMVNVDGYNVHGFKYINPELSEFVIFYAENIDGVKSFYCYDIKDKTIQRAVEFSKEFNNALQLKIESEKNVFTRFMALDLVNKIVVISGLAIMLLVIALLIVFTIKILRKTVDEEQENIEGTIVEPFKNKNHMLPIKKKDTDKKDNK